MRSIRISSLTKWADDHHVYFGEEGVPGKHELYSLRLPEVAQFRATLECLFGTTFGHLHRILLLHLHEGTQARKSTVETNLLGEHIAK